MVEALQKFAIETLFASPSLSLLSLKWVALLREAIDYFEEEQEEEKEMSTRFTGLCSVPHFIRSHNFTCFIFYSVSSLWINYVLHPATGPSSAMF